MLAALQIMYFAITHNLSCSTPILHDTSPPVGSFFVQWVLQWVLVMAFFMKCRSLHIFISVDMSHAVLERSSTVLFSWVTLVLFNLSLMSLVL